MDIVEAIREANALLPGMPSVEGPDPRWQAIIRVGEFTESDPEAVWGFICHWGRHEQKDLRDAVATCLLEHLLEHYFKAYFDRVEQFATSEPLFADTFRRCWQLGQALEPGNAERFASLIQRL